MAAKQILIGERIYAAKKDALTAVREVRDRVRDTGRVTAEDDDFIRDLLAMHPRVAVKVGSGVERFEVRDNAGTNGFWIIRTDGSATDFSFMQCLNGATHQDLVRSAMRRAVIDQMQDARDREFSTTNVRYCAVTGDQITADNCHMDHEAPTFVEIADAFASAEGGYGTIAVTSDDGLIGHRFVNVDVSARWERWHRDRASIRAVSKKANLSVLRRGIPRRPRA